MYKKGKKLCSTPMKVEPGSSSLSLSDVKPSSSDTASLIRGICCKGLVRKNVERNEKKCKRKVGKFKEFARKIRERMHLEFRTSIIKCEVQQYSLENKLDKQQEATIPLFKSPERQRDLGVEKDYVLSPPLIGPRGRNLHVIEGGAVDKKAEEDKHVVPLSENEEEAYNSSPIFERSKVVRTYPPPKKTKKWEAELLPKKENGDWLIELKMPTVTADLLWETYIENRPVELWNNRSSDTEEDNPLIVFKYEDDKKEHSDDTLVFLNENKRQLSKTNKLYSIKGGCSRTHGPLPVEFEKYVKVNNEWKRCTTKRKKFTDICSTSHLHPDLQKEDGTLIRFNEFHARSKMKKNINTDCLAQKTVNVKVISMEKFKGTVYKQPDGNFRIIRH